MNSMSEAAAFVSGGPQVVDAAFITYRLEEAGSTLLALPQTGHSTKLRVSSLDVVQEAQEACAAGSGRIRPPIPAASRITRMDEATGLDIADPQGTHRHQEDRGRTLPGEPGDGAAPVFVAAAG